MKIFNFIFLVLFVISAALQYNDPDPYLWIPLYLYGAFLCWQAIQKKYVPSLFIIGLAVYGGYGFFLLFDSDGVLSWAGQHDSKQILQSMKATKPWIEETREFFGLVLLMMVLIVNMVWLSRKVPENILHKNMRSSE
jgi:hypothetical protein